LTKIKDTNGSAENEQDNEIIILTLRLLTCLKRYGRDCYI